MGTKYGIGYQGSKAKIADNIIALLPSGKRFVDLFGGGFAMSHAALLSGKWERVWYNDIDKLLVEFVTDAIHGRYNFKNFTPYWVSHEDFNKHKNTNGYVKFIWSFGNDGRSYLYGAENERKKKAVFDYLVYNQRSETLEELAPDFVTRELDLHDRRKDWLKHCRESGKRNDNYVLARIQSLESLERLESLESLERLTTTYMDYHKYEYQEGDVVYCDPPYIGEKCYGVEFDHQEFFRWVEKADFPIYFSERAPKFEKIWQKDVRVTMDKNSNSLVKPECVYWNKK
jgi:site-specific DNA-adenine methylase